MLDGCVYTNDEEDLSEEEFSNAFVEFIEKKRMEFRWWTEPDRRRGKSYTGY